MPRIKLSKPAEKDLEQSLREGLPLTFARLADLYRRCRQFQKAEEVCKEGLEAFPTYGTGHIVLADIQMDKGETEKALVQYHMALKCEPDNLRALMMIADLHWQAEAYSLARSYYKQVLRRDHHCQTALDRVKGKPSQVKDETSRASMQLNRNQMCLELLHSRGSMQGRVILIWPERFA